MDFARRAYDQSSDEEFRSNVLEYDDIQKLVHSDSRYDFLIDTTPKRIKFSEAMKLVEEANEREEIRRKEEARWKEEKRKEQERRKEDARLKEEEARAKHQAPTSDNEDARVDTNDADDSDQAAKD